jgi:SAM-dependent methyltransferase
MKSYRAIAEYYDAEHADMKMLRHDVPFFLGQLPKKKQSILELATGTARAAIPIAQAGHSVVGVDYARDLLTIARHKRDAAGLAEAELELRYGDIRKLKLSRRFDWICIFFNTFLGFPTLPEQDQLLQTVKKYLKPNGRFWLDIFQPDLRLLSRQNIEAINPRQFYIPALKRTVLQTTDIHQEVSRQVQHVTYKYSWFDSAGRLHTGQNKFTLTWLFPRELQLLLERNGLQIERLWGNYDGSKLNDESPRMIARCVMA